jgi:hypothetical protein
MSHSTQWLRDATEATPALTPSAIARRDSMREMLQTAVVTRRRRRQAFRWAGAAALVTVLALAALPQTEAADTPGNREFVTFELETVRNDPGLLARYAVPTSPHSADTWIGDDELLELLDSAGRTTGLIRVNETLTLTADVTDEIEVEN